MPKLCLPKSQRDELLQALKDKEITLARLFEMTSEERNTMFSHYVGSSFASLVNGKFEQAMLSRQKNALAKWIESTVKEGTPVRRDLLKKISKLEKALTVDEERGFLKDLAEMKLGIGVTEEEAQTILKLKGDVDRLKAEIPVTSPANSTERLAYGLALDDFKQFVGNLKTEADTLKFTERLKPKNYWQDVKDAAGVAKSLLASFDNSFIGRQGWKLLLTGRYKQWAQMTAKSFELIGKELVAKHPQIFGARDDAAMRTLRASIYSRPNALNGKYTAAKNGYELGTLTEEAFPVSFPERLPVIGRIYKAAESAFNGSALYARANLADAVIAQAEQNGVDMLDEAQASAFGKLVGSMTGRGNIGKVGAIGQEVNALLFSVRFLKSNFDVLTAHLLDKNFTPEARKVAVGNILKIAASLTALLGIAKTLNPDSVDFDPRGGRAGKIRIANHDYDISGGLTGLLTLGSRLVPTLHNGEWGFWSKSPTSGVWTKSGSGQFGEQTALDTFEQFFEGKLSPAAGVVRDIWKGQNFSGQKPDVVNTAIGLITPISAQLLTQELQKGNDDLLLAMIAESLGFSTTQTLPRGYGTRWGKLQDKVDSATYNEALRTVYTNFNDKAKTLQSSDRFKQMTNQEQADALQNLRAQETDRVMARYGL